ncbi:MAG: thioredoxin fold domain-containing protein [Prevotellaceae bacterium]|jgi:thiol:disulfide interchange protein DsbD|nr:thioredoxin fold domain-containing protein [Prevotellaceae bacterium]
MKKLLLIILGIAFGIGVGAQEIKTPVKWRFEAQRVSENEVEIYFTAEIEKPWIVYGVNVPEDGPIPLTVVLEEDAVCELMGELIELTSSKEKFDEMFDMSVPYFSKNVKLVQRVHLKGDAGIISGAIEYQTCSDTECIPFYEEFSVSIPQKIEVSTVGANNERESLWLFFALAMLAGFAGVITPCVFPMLPMTISFFMRNRTRKQTLIQVLVFGLSIVLIYTSIGVIVSATKSVAFTNVLSTHWIPNLIFFILFILFAASFFGAVEITLPSRFANRIDKQADKGGYLSTFFVALALCVVSFSCTGPFVGALLVAAASGAVLKPIIGMLGFGLAFALPFTLLALFPSVMKKLPKSGGWMNTVKVFFAFVMALFSMKFLSMADQALRFNLISREIFLCIWIVLFIMLGLYFLGKIHFKHDDKKDYASFGRFAFSTASFVFALYLFTGLFGNPLNFLSGFLPPENVKSKVVNMLGTSNEASKTSVKSTLCSTTVRYADVKGFSGPAGLPTYFDLDEALVCAEQQGKPILIDFKGHFCTNCKKMEAEVFSDVEIQKLLENFIIAALYTDDKTPLPEGEWYVSKFDGKMKKTLGQKNMDYMITKYKVNAAPYFAIIDKNEKPIGAKPVGYTGLDNFKEFLRSAL